MQFLQLVYRRQRIIVVLCYKFSLSFGTFQLCPNPAFFGHLYS